MRREPIAQQQSENLLVFGGFAYFLLVVGRSRSLWVVTYSLWVIPGCFLLVVGRFRSVLVRLRSFQVVSGRFLVAVDRFKSFQVD